MAGQDQTEKEFFQWILIYDDVGVSLNILFPYALIIYVSEENLSKPEEICDRFCVSDA